MAVHDHHKQHYALREDGNLVHIKDTAKGDGHVYRCPYCKQEYDPKRGEINAWHFAHKKDSDVPCSYDHYLHTLAEQKFLEWYNSAPKVQIQLCNKKRCNKFGKCHFACEECEKDSRTEPYDLKEIYETAELERSFRAQDENNYIADIKLSSSKHPDDPIFLEIYVTHACTPEKKDSGIRIIEIPISSEEDIERWTNGACWKEQKRPAYFEYKRDEKEWDKSNLRFYGFKPSDKNVSNWPLLEIIKYRLSWAPFREELILTDCQNCYEHDGYFEIIGRRFGFVAEMICRSKAIECKAYPQQCLMCRFSKQNTYALLCNRHKKDGKPQLCPPDGGLSCHDYMIDQTTYDFYLKVFDNFSEESRPVCWVKPQD